MIYEDFYPLNQDSALIVAGQKYTKLDEIRMVAFKIENNRVIITDSIRLRTGIHFRLGNIYDEIFTFSDNYIIYICHEKNTPIPIREGEQPYLFDEGILYKKDGKLCLNDTIIVSPWGDIQEIGRPIYANGKIYFEARTKPAPQGWQVWRSTLDGKNKEKILDSGANPYVFNGYIYYSKWNDQRFDTHIEKVKDAVEQKCLTN